MADRQNEHRMAQDQPNASNSDLAPGRQEMDLIRQRRLEKLGGKSSASSEAPTTSPDATHPSSAGGSSSKPTTQPLSRTATTVTSAPPPKSTPVTCASPLSSKPAPEISQQQSRKTASPQSIDDFADGLISRVFRMTLDSNKTEDRYGALTFLQSSRAELEASGAPLKLSVDGLDQYLFEAASQLTGRSLFDYFASSYKLVSAMFSRMRQPTPEQTSVVKEVKRLTVSHCIFCLTMPELYGRDSNASDESLVPYLLQSHATDSILSFDLMNDIVGRTEEDDSIKPLFVKAMVILSVKLSKITLATREHDQYMNALLLYTKFPVLVEALAQDPYFGQPVPAQDIESKTLLGPFFRLSPLHRSDSMSYYPTPQNTLPSVIQSGDSGVVADLNTIWTNLHNIATAFIHAGEKSRQRLLEWFSYILNNNHGRAKTYPDVKTLSSDGFMLNVSVVLDLLCQPFMSPTLAKVDRIQYDYYFRPWSRLDIREETKIWFDEKTAEEVLRSHEVPGTCNFITDIFMLAVAGHHYGVEGIKTNLKNARHSANALRAEVERVEGIRSNLPPQHAERADQALEKWRLSLDQYAATELACKCTLRFERRQNLSMMTMRYLAVWLLRLASQTQYLPGKPLQLPLPSEAPREFAALPEYYVTVLLNSVLHVFERTPELSSTAFGDEMFIFCIAFLSSTNHLKNPSIKTNMVHILRWGTVSHNQQHSGGIWGQLLMGHAFSQKFLLRSLMRFYIESETTISFYDKFNVRYLIFEVIKFVWQDDAYKLQLERESKQDTKFFVQFVKLVLNDATYVLDEALTRFPKIHDLEIEIAEGQQMSLEERQQKLKDLQSLMGQAASYMQLTNSIMDMMVLFTGSMKGAFLMPEIVERLAAMLDYNIHLLTGPKSKSLKTSQMQKYHFEPRTLLGQFVDVYLSLGTSSDFVAAVAADGRSYSPENMAVATAILEKTQVKAPAELARWIKLCDKFADTQRAMEQAELDLGEIPPEFEDPLLGHLMKDPVILPSQNIVDRGTITEHLLSNATDPFTRQAMSPEDVVSATDLKAKIEAWKADKLREAASRVADKVPSSVTDSVGDRMDTGE